MALCIPHNMKECDQDTVHSYDYISVLPLLILLMIYKDSAPGETKFRDELAIVMQLQLC